MKKLVGTLINAALLCFTYAGSALGIEIMIDPADYTGIWSVDYGHARRGPAVVNLGAPDSTTGAHVISISGAELFFDVGRDGTVTVRNRASATGSAGKLTLKTTAVKIDPVYFRGDWRISAGATQDLRGVQVVSLVPGLKFYNMEVGAIGGFSFHLADDGVVTVRNPLAATGGGRTLTLKSTERFR